MNKEKSIDIAQGIKLVVNKNSSFLRIECKIYDKRFNARYLYISDWCINMFVDIIKHALELSQKYKQSINIQTNFTGTVLVSYKNDDDVSLVFMKKDNAYKGEYYYDETNEYTFTHKAATNIKEIDDFIEKVLCAYSQKNELMLQLQNEQ